jgi:hypothetical protein
VTLAEELRKKYGLTSLKARGEHLVVLAINEVIELAAEMADQEQSPVAAARIRALKWAECVSTPVPVVGALKATRTA